MQREERQANGGDPLLHSTRSIGIVREVEVAGLKAGITRTTDLIENTQERVEIGGIDGPCVRLCSEVDAWPIDCA